MMDDEMSWEVVEGDCLDVLPTLGTGSVDAVVMDPPYAIPTNVAQGRSVTRNVGDLSLVEHSFRSLFGELARILKPTGRMFVFCDGVSYPVVFRAAYGSWRTALLVWDKQRIGMGREFRKSHELILHGWLPDTPVVGSECVGYADILRCPPVAPTSRSHPAEKPVALIESLLRICGNVVLDPFAGSGAVGKACIRTGRSFVGIEIEPAYCEIARRRMTAEIERTPLLDARP